MPPMLTRLVSVYLLLTGLAVAVQFIIFPFYEDRDTDLTVWGVLDWFMAVALLLALAGTFLLKRAFDASNPDPHWRDYVETNGLFYGVLALTLAFFPAWFWLEWGAYADERLSWATWHVIDTAMPILFALVGLRLWRSA